MSQILFEFMEKSNKKVEKEHYLTSDEKSLIYTYIKLGKSCYEISKLIKRAHSTVLRYIRRYNIEYDYEKQTFIEFKKNKDKELKKLEELQTRIENLEMQIEILIDHIKKQ